ncbi:MAG: four helix bundle protein [Terriglobia bacterium]|jgi:four helix bundle protein|nr:four helix bundle protein [Terriglobia bacterium]
MSDYRNLEVWQRAHRATLNIYNATEKFPKSEMFGLTSQMRRAALSIACNIVEGLGRHSDRELVRFLRISIGSADELEYQLLVAKDLRYITEVEHEKLQVEVKRVGRMLTSLASRVLARVSSG